ncbi:3-deoxy-7-phosphoheptulonate synthase [Xenorhabdus bovienii]|uniref:3-deoxy-7-phosphoheptulonate synthase class II n=1 Tax=Xenorhabdus bovienii TaxID=40576 RepID=UPI001EE06FF7|nr:3-deoxy-7-phosphoheptulonate synthase class II [Xenorhabdus bovienii]MCG3463995.1 3-deoxy-7-phosphoheptulonate synthase [Xenorhabdus bovienii]
MTTLTPITSLSTKSRLQQTETEFIALEKSVGKHIQRKSFTAIAVNNPGWRPTSWRQKSAIQQPSYENEVELAETVEQLTHWPSIVTSEEILKLKQLIADAQEGKHFIIQGGDCAESFDECTPEFITSKIKILLQMSFILSHGLQLPIIPIGRFAGQYAKPRSNDIETKNGITLPIFRGDIVNSSEFSPRARRADPRRLIQAHVHSAMAMNFARAFVKDNLTNLYKLDNWELDWIKHSKNHKKYNDIVNSILNTQNLNNNVFPSNHYFTSHEALLLQYEETQTRFISNQKSGWFNLSTHFPWIGMRTAALDGAHIEYFRGIQNPIAVKIGPSIKPDELIRLIDILNPHEEPGRLTLITRMGNNRISENLPPLLKAVQNEGRRVLWICDPMHGNTESSSNGYKTRLFNNIFSELEQAIDIHASANNNLGGIHIELTGEDVSECLGGAKNLNESDLPRAYKTAVDPRLNYEQSLELAMMITCKFNKYSSIAM